MKYKIGKLDHEIYATTGDSINLTITRANNEKLLHSEEIKSPRRYTHWMFMEIEDGIGTAVFMGDERLEEWFLYHFPNATRLSEDEYLYE